MRTLNAATTVQMVTTTTCTYTVRVKVDDGDGGSTSISSEHKCYSDVDEPPAAPGAPRVTATKDTGWSLDVTWSEPRNTGKPPITDYDIQYRKVKSGTDQDDWELWPHGTDQEGNTDTSTRDNKESSGRNRRSPGAPHPVRGAREGKERGK